MYYGGNKAGNRKGSENPSSYIFCVQFLISTVIGNGFFFGSPLALGFTLP